MAQHVKVVSYDSEWPEIYEREKNLILQILGEEAAAIYHIAALLCRDFAQNQSSTPCLSSGISAKWTGCRASLKP